MMSDLILKFKQKKIKILIIGSVSTVFIASILLLKDNWKNVGDNFYENYPTLAKMAVEDGTTDLYMMTPVEAIGHAIVGGFYCGLIFLAAFLYINIVIKMIKLAKSKESTLLKIVGWILIAMPPLAILLLAWVLYGLSQWQF